MKWSHRLSAPAVSTRENSAVSTNVFYKVTGNILSPGFAVFFFFDKKKKLYIWNVKFLILVSGKDKVQIKHFPAPSFF